MILPKLKIGQFQPELPIIQGGMAIRISTAPLAAAVANEGGIGLIAATGMELSELQFQIKKARELSKGIIGINIMVAARQFVDLVKVAIKEKIDLIVAGAGFSRDLFPLGVEAGIPIVPIVSTSKLAAIAEKLGASAVIVEGKEAGGHLGTDISVKTLIPEVKDAVSIPVVGAGGIVTANDIAEMINLGADGVQMGIRFALSSECNAAENWKQVCLDAKDEDIVLIDSPVGLRGRAIRTSFVEKLFRGEVSPPTDCKSCLKHCSRSFCILQALNNAQMGNIEEGLVFSGEYVGQIKDVISVREIFASLKEKLSSL